MLLVVYVASADDGACDRVDARARDDSEAMWPDLVNECVDDHGASGPARHIDAWGDHLTCSPDLLHGSRETQPSC
jgi:hypothetical protein